MATKKEDKKELRHSEWEEQIADCQSNGMKIYAYSQKKNRAKMVLALLSVTAKVAEKLAKETNADIYEIKPAVQYTKADLNWMDKTSRSSIEMSDHNSRPEIADKNADISKYDTIYLGFPIWWYIAPTIINTFLESYDFSGKKIILFATSGGSGFGKTLINLKSSAVGAEIIEGKVNPTLNEISAIAKM